MAVTSARKIIFMQEMDYYTLAFSNQNILTHGEVLNHSDLAPFPSNMRQAV